MKINLLPRATVLLAMAVATFTVCLQGTFVLDDNLAVIESMMVHAREVKISSVFAHDFG